MMEGDLDSIPVRWLRRVGLCTIGVSMLVLLVIIGAIGGALQAAIEGCQEFMRVWRK